MDIKNKITHLLLAIILMVSTGSLYAQSGRQRITREQLAEVQAKYIAGKMNMESATSNRFVKTYCQFQKELWALGSRQRRGRYSSTNEETGESLKRRFAQSQKILDLREKYYGIYSQFLTQNQIRQVYLLEKQIMNRLRAKGAHRRR